MSAYLAFQRKLGYFDLGTKANIMLCERNLEWLQKKGHQSPEDNRIWSVIQKLYTIQGRYGLAISFNQLVEGTKLIVNVTGPILHRLRLYLKDDNLKMQLMFQQNTWRLNIDAFIEADGRTVYRSPKNWNQKAINELKQALKSGNTRVSVVLTTEDGNQSTIPALPPILYDRDPTKAMLKKALEEQIHCDFELVAENKARIPCHKVFLACQSEVFQRMFETNCIESREKACTLKQSEETVRAFIKYVYYGDLVDAKKDQRIAFNLMEMGHCYNIPYLENAIKIMFLKVSPASLDVNVALLLFSFACNVEGYEEIKGKAGLLIRSKPREAFEGEALDSIMKYEPDTVKQLLAIGL